MLRVPTSHQALINNQLVHRVLAPAISDTTNLLQIAIVDINSLVYVPKHNPTQEEYGMITIGRDTTITWLGHATFHIRTPGGKNILIDAWVDTNPACPQDWKDRIRTDGLDAIFVTHGHFDHIADVVAIAQATGAIVVGQYDLTGWLASKGIDQNKLVGFNKGGTVNVAGIRATMTHATHSSTFTDNEVIVPLGSEAGYVFELENGFTIYHTGDTAVTADMQIIGDLYKPELCILPIGDHFTMGPRQAAYALKLIQPKYAIPEHYATFPLLSGTPAALREHCKEFGVQVEVLAPAVGESLT
jgi:L-ascorbate metabolism protein UlaG (beta-lactamase superfamily)